VPATRQRDVFRNPLKRFFFHECLEQSMEELREEMVDEQ
jgi:hypothetical protein